MSKKSKKKGKTFERFCLGLLGPGCGWEEQVLPQTVLLPLAVENLLGKCKRLGEGQEEAGLQIPPRPLPRAGARQRQQKTVCVQEKAVSPWRQLQSKEKESTTAAPCLLLCSWHRRSFPLYLLSKIECQNLIQCLINCFYHVL